MTTENLPAIRTEAEVTRADTDSWVEVMRPILALAEKISDTEFVPKGLRGSMPATAAAMLYGREVGLAPMTALNMTHVVEGKPGLSAEGMRALVLAGGHAIEVVETTGAACIMRARRRGSETWTSISWTLDMARAAGLLGKNNWKAHPRQMLQARCTTELCRLVFPDVIHGFRGVEELEDMAEGDGPAASLTATQTTTKVGRRGARKTAALPAGKAADSAPAPAGPPLPGEPGYDDTQTSGTGAAPADSPERGSEDPPAPEPEQADDPADESAPPGDAEPDGDGSSVEQTGGIAADEESAAPGEPTGEAGDSTPPASPRRATRAQERMLFADLSRFGVGSDDREERLYLSSRILRRQITSWSQLTFTDAKHLIETLARLKDRAALDGLLDTIDQAEEERADVEAQDLAGEPEQSGDES